MKSASYLVAILCLMLFGCNSKPSLQRYFVDSQEKQGFMVVDISPSILNVDKTKLTAEQNRVLSSFKKMNILAYKMHENNKSEFDAESAKINTILKDTTTYQQLIKIGSGKDGASVSFIGDENHIKEFILYGCKREQGFAVVRILGDNMNPEDAMVMFSILKSSKIDAKQLEPLKDLMKK